jgi:hypothetical protein
MYEQDSAKAKKHSQSSSPMKTAASRLTLSQRPMTVLSGVRASACQADIVTDGILTAFAG